MKSRKGIWTRWKMALAAAGILTPFLSGCQSPDEGKSAENTRNDGSSGSADVGFLLTMTFGEAKAISPKNLIFPPFYNIAADEIIVESTDSKGQPRRVRAKGRVFLQIDYREPVLALGQEALISSGEVILRGKPLMKRGSSVVEGLDDSTVFYIEGTKLHAIGSHRLTSQGGVTSNWKNTWREGPNPLLPALSPDDVPKEIRASPLLPLPSGMEKPEL